MIDTAAQLQQRLSALLEARQLAEAARYALEFVIAKHDDAIAQHEAALQQLGTAQLAQVAATRHYDAQRQRNAQRIDQLRREVHAEYAARREHLNKGHLAWLRNNHADARYHSQEAQECLAIISSLKESQQDVRADTRALKDDLDEVRQRTQQANDDVARVADEVRQLEKEVARAKQHRDDAHRTRRYWEDLFRKSWPDIARAAEVPEEYVHATKVKVDDRGETNIYFGGEGEPAGPGHAHHVLNANGELYYRRRLGDPHGPQNFIPLPGPRVRTA